MLNSVGIPNSENAAVMIFIDDWTSRASSTNQSGTGKNDPMQAPSAEIIKEEIGKISDLPILNVHCYEDVGYPWVQVVFDDKAPIHPSAALRIGGALVAAVGQGRVYFNSLRPSALYFVLYPPFPPAPDLPVERYGVDLDTLIKAWSKPVKKGPQ